MKSLELRDRKVQLCADERKIFEAAKAENRAYTVDELEKIEKLEAEMRAIDEQSVDCKRQEEAAAAVEARMSEPVHEFTMSGDLGSTGAGAGGSGLSATESRWFNDMIEGRTTQSTSTISEFIPKPLQDRMIQLLDRVSAARQVADVFTVASPVRVARQSSYGTTLTAVAEAGAAVAYDPGIDEIDTSTKISKGFGESTLTVELLQDSQFDTETVVMNMIAEAAGHFQENEFMNGDGSGNPEGLMVAITGANTFDVGGSGTLTATRVTEALLTKLPPQYMGLPRWLVVSQKAAAELLSDEDDNGRLLLQQQASSTFANMPSMSILGTQILISSAAPGGSGNAGAWANNDYMGTILTQGSYGIYDHGGFQMLRDPYSGGTNGLVKVNGWIRSAGIVQRPQSIVQITF
jgi:HK97 family phage major capsid protein